MVTHNAIKIALCFALSGISAVFASESGLLASRAQKSMKAGRFSKAYSQLERALTASRKEADIRAENRIFIAMVQLHTMSLDFNIADSLLSYVNLDEADRSTRIMWVKAKMGLRNANAKYTDAVSLCESVSEKDLDEIDDNLQGMFYSDCAIAYAGTHNEEKANKALKMVDKRIDDDTGIYYWTQARMADLQSQGNADEFYRKAESKSVEANTPYTTANILYHRGKYLSKSNRAEAKKLFERCKTAFELMGLPNNANRCSE